MTCPLWCGLSPPVQAACKGEMVKGSQGTATTLARNSSKCESAPQGKRSPEPSMTTAQAVWGSPAVPEQSWVATSISNPRQGKWWTRSRTHSKVQSGATGNRSRDKYSCNTAQAVIKPSVSLNGAPGPLVQWYGHASQERLLRAINTYWFPQGPEKHLWCLLILSLNIFKQLLSHVG